jgi:diadenosine tetraphosphatase ApaH/serine/threonine PP2A family protein phosphatase
MADPFRSSSFPSFSFLCKEFVPVRYCVFGDIHGNLEALEVVLKHAAGEGAERYICVGDIIGYGANPHECMERVRGLTEDIVAGNHECAIVGRADVEYFNPYAREAVHWTSDRLTAAEKEFLANLPLLRVVDGFTVVHATVHSPNLFGYIESSMAARLSFEALQTTLCFVGHSHVPVTFFYNEDGAEIWYTQDTEIPLGDFSRTIINVGSVGQPRDDNPNAAYILYDSVLRKATVHRAHYDVEAARKKILDAGLPEILADRLLVGR